MEIYLNPKILPILNTDKRYIVLYGGRASMKSWATADILLLKSFTEINIIILCVKGTMRSISDSVKALLEQSIIRNNWSSFFYITDKEIICKTTGSKFIFSGLQHPDRIKSIERIKYLWIEEAAIDVTEEALDILPPTIFRVKDSKIFITFNPRYDDDPIYKAFIINKNVDALVIKLNYYDNPWLSDEIKREIELDKEKDYQKYLHVWEGKLRKEIEGALWNKDMIKYVSPDEYAKYLLTSFDKVVVSIDPSVTAKATSDACGLIVAGKINDKYIILDDKTKIMSPQTWAEKAVALYDEYEADHITFESNQGGDLVKTLIRNINPKIRCIGVHARRGKKVRAEEILYLYETGQVKHYRPFKTLEYEMVTFTGEKKEKSPNALDAMVYALKDLSPGRYKTPAGLVNASMSSLAKPMGTARLRY